MPISRLSSPFQACLRLARDCAAVSAVEFALLLPLMVTIYLGGVEIGDGIAVQFRATLAARTVADLASRYTSIDTSTMSSILNAASTVIAPYSPSGMGVTVSEVTTDNQGRATITWSCALNATAHSFGSSATLPSNVNAPNISIIWGEVKYPYTPTLGYVITGTIHISQQMYFYPRLASSVTGPSTSGACPTS
jgi:Flp pilus assembly protein TadG